MTDRVLLEKVLEAMEHLNRTGDTQVFDLCYAPELIPALRERLAQPEHDWEAEYVKQVELHNQTLDELRDALAQPEQEPVAWRWKERINNDFDSWVVTSSEPPPYAIEQQPLYTTPPRREWVGLTDEEITQVIDSMPNKFAGFMVDWDLYEFTRAVEAAHGIK